MKSCALVKAPHCLGVSVGDLQLKVQARLSHQHLPLNAHTHPCFDVFGRKVMALLTFSFLVFTFLTFGNGGCTAANNSLHSLETCYLFCTVSCCS